MVLIVNEGARFVRSCWPEDLLPDRGLNFQMPISPKLVAAKKQICSSSFFHGRYQRLRVLIPE
jgi:hypothetical protein